MTGGPAMTTTDERQHHLIQVAFSRAQLSVEELWMRYFSLGGSAGPVELEAFVDGMLTLDPLQRDLVAHAINERLDELHWRHRAPYSRTVREPGRETGLLASLVRLLGGSHLAPPDALPEVVARAGQAIGVTTVVYLLDYSMRALVPFPGRDDVGLTTLSLDGTMAGRALRTITPQHGTLGEGPRLWVPIIDGVERIGVLDVRVPDRQDLDDPTLHEQCWWLAHLAGHLITALGDYGDAVDRVRRTEPRTVAAELIWQLLPPLTVATDKVVLSAQLEPSARVGGDVFDYALSGSTVHVAVIDAVGHDLAAGLVSATALAAYRNARRQGRSLEDEAAAIDVAIRAQFGAETFATGVVGQLDLDSGRFRYVAAGHPFPAILRAGRVVKSLDGGRRTPFGLDSRPTTVAEEHLEPGDCLVLYTDGITEARDADGVQFGLAGLADFLEREDESRTPLPEVVRRLCRAIMARQSGVLADDATVVLVHWTSTAQLGLGAGPFA